MWAQPETNLPNWQNWMVLEGSSEFGEQLASSYYELTVALLPNRFNGILQNSHFRVSPTPADGLATLAQNIGGLASLLLREYAQDPSDWGTDTSAVYRYLQATPPPPGISGPQVTTIASLGLTHTQDLKTTNDPTSATSSRVTPEKRKTPGTSAAPMRVSAKGTPATIPWYRLTASQARHLANQEGIHRPPYGPSQLLGDSPCKA